MKRRAAGLLTAPTGARLWTRVLLLVALAIVLPLAACSDDDDDAAAADAADSATPTAIVAPAALTTIVAPPPPDIVPQDAAEASRAFQNDPDLEPFLEHDALALPDRFQLVAREDLEPILALGLVSGAARVTFSSGITNELLLVDLLRLEDGLDSGAFFDDFADAVADDSAFGRIRSLGIPRGIGERARHYTFSVDDDEADAAVLLREGVIAFVKYRRPPYLRQPVDVAALLQTLDAALQSG